MTLFYQDRKIELPRKDNSLNTWNNANGDVRQKAFWD